MDILERLEAAPYGTFGIDLDQNIIFWNAKAERILGYGPEQVLGRKCYEVLQSLALDGATPFRTRDCPAMATARTSHIPAAKRARMQSSSGERKRVAVIPLIARDGRGRTLLIHMFHETPGEGSNSKQADALPLTPREPEVLCMLAQGKRPADIAADLSVSVHTARKRISNATEKLHSHGAMAAVLAAHPHHHHCTLVVTPPSSSPDLTSGRFLRSGAHQRLLPKNGGNGDSQEHQPGAKRPGTREFAPSADENPQRKEGIPAKPVQIGICGDGTDSSHREYARHAAREWQRKEGPSAGFALRGKARKKRKNGPGSAKKERSWKTPSRDSATGSARLSASAGTAKRKWAAGAR